ncbi:hypothetical protein, partial [Defluviimonas salinarum]
MKPHAEIDQSRTDAGRKIDTWRFSLPDGKRLEVAISLHSSREEMEFTTKAEHPVFRDLALRGTDLQTLRDEVQAWVRARIEDHWGADWGHGFLVEVDYVNIFPALKRRGFPVAPRRHRAAPERVELTLRRGLEPNPP